MYCIELLHRNMFSQRDLHESEDAALEQINKVRSVGALISAPRYSFVCVCESYQATI